MTQKHEARHAPKEMTTHTKKSTYLICTTARSGSNLFCDYLKNSNILGKPAEFFNPDVIRSTRYYKENSNENSLSVQLYLNWLRSTHSSTNGVFGVKLLYEDFDNLRSFAAVRGLFDNSHIIFLRRRSKIRQAISYFFASETGQWVASDPPLKQLREVEFDFSAIKRHLFRLTDQDARWQAILVGLEYSYQELYFEDLVADPAGAIRAVANALEVADAESDFRVQADLAEQKNEMSKDFYRMFCTDFTKSVFDPQSKKIYKNLHFNA